MALSKPEVEALYRKRARHYDLTARLYGLLGFRYTGYRRQAIAALGLRSGDTVVEIGCGTGENFPLLEERIGPGGRLIGVDLTDAMLAEARARVSRAGWRNVELVQSDAASYEFPAAVNGVLSTYALTLDPEYDAVIRRAAAALRAGRRFVILDFKQPDGWPRWLLDLVVPFVRPFGVSLDLAARHPWESVARHFPISSMTELYLGTTYVAVGETR